MSATSERELTPFQHQLQQRRVVKHIVSDLFDSSRSVETPVGLVTLVDIKFLRELADVTQVSGELVFAVVDETHLHRVAATVGLIEEIPKPQMIDGSPLVVNATDLKAAIRWKGWTAKQAAIEFGVSYASINNWIYGYGAPRGENRRRAYDLIQAMRAELRASEGDTGK